MQSMANEVDIPSRIDALLAPFALAERAARDKTFSFRDSGEGRPLVLHHGIGSSSASWVYQLQELGQSCRVIAWDAPGYGVSSPLDDAAPSAADYATALRDFIDVLEIDHIVLVGHSLGALIAAAFARHYPERIERLVLVSPARGYGFEIPTERNRKLNQRLTLLAELGINQHARTRAPNLLRSEPAPEALTLVERSLAQLHPEGYAQAAHMLANGDILVDLEHWRRPLFVLSGDHDRITPVPHCRAIAEATHQGRYVEIQAGGHAVYIDAPLRFNAILEEFMEGAHE